ncbi:MAG: discoidin domain-containing protein [bacterium]|nr:discoidin domain-containing protein [bacterium]
MIQESAILRNDRIGRTPSVKIPALAIGAMLLFLLPLASLTDSAGLLADAGPITALPGGNVRPVTDSQIHLDSELVRIRLGQEGYRVEVRYQFRNAGKARTVEMGFPNSKPVTFMDSPLKNFEAALLVSGREEPLKVTPKASPDPDASPWDLFETFSVPFAAGQRRTLINRYEQIYQSVNYDGDYDEVKYILRTGALWAGKIKKARFEIFFDRIHPEDTKSRVGVFWNYESKTFEYYPYGGWRLEGGPGKVVSNKEGLVIEYFNIEPDFDVTLRLPHRLYAGASSSSQLKGKDAQGEDRYAANKAIDKDVSTAWVEGAAGAGVGESLTIFAAPTKHGGKVQGWYLIEGVEIVNGCARDQQLFLANGRVRKVRVELYSVPQRAYNPEFPLVSAQEMELKDRAEAQVIEFAQPVITAGVKLTILSVYPGEKFQDTCIAEVRLLPVQLATDKDSPF